MTEKRRYDRYRKNLFTRGDSIFSYNTEVAKLDREKGKITTLGWWSMTTSKHINYIARIWGFDVEKKR